jgi:hypothetical protein
MSNFIRIDVDDFAFDLFGSRVRLKRNNDSWSLTGRRLPSPIVLDESEVTAALLIGRKPEASELLNIGLDPSYGKLAPDVKFLRDQVGEADSVLLDRTTLASAGIALDIMPTAVTLLDLSTVTNAFVLYEQVVVQRHGRQPETHGIPAALKGALKVLHYTRPFLMGTLWNANLRAADAATAQGTNPMIDAWRVFLGRDDISLNQSLWDSAQDSAYTWDGIPASHYFGDIGTPSMTPRTADELRSLNDFLSIQTIRALFNDSLAGMLDVPYIPTSIRSPIHSILLSQKIRTQSLADRLLSQIGPPLLEAPNTTAYVAEVSAPFLLGIALSRMRAPDDYWGVVEELRDSFAPLRTRIAADREEWQGRSGVYLSEYLKHLKGYMPLGLQVAQEAALGTAGVVAVASPLGGGLVNLAVKMACALKTTGKAYTWYLKRFKPYIHVAVEMATEARALRSVENEIERIWRSKWSRGEHDHLERLSASRPEMFSRLRKLDASG